MQKPGAGFCPVRFFLCSHGEFELVLKDGHRSRVSRTYRMQLEKRLGQSL